jgi:AraC-like DNA-binding protein
MKSPHRHTFYEILYVTEGRGTHVIDFAPYPVRPNTLYFISPGQVHFWQVDTPVEGPALLFTEEFLLFPSAGLSVMDELSFFYDVTKSPQLRLKKKQAEHFNRFIQNIEDEYHSNQFGRTSLLRAYLNVLLIQIQRIYDEASTKSDLAEHSRLVRHFKQLVARDLSRQRSIQIYADRLGVSASRLYDTVRAVSGQTPGQIIRGEIALEAKRLLAHSDLTVAETGYTLGFEDPSYFGRFLRRETGMSPRTFRQHIREKYHFFPK